MTCTLKTKIKIIEKIKFQLCKAYEYNDVKRCCTLAKRLERFSK